MVRLSLLTGLCYCKLYYIMFVSRRQLIIHKSAEFLGLEFVDEGGRKEVEL